MTIPCRRLATAPRASLDPDNANILVCGGGGVAMEVTRKLKDMGSWVWAMQRSDTRRCVLVVDGACGPCSTLHGITQTRDRKDDGRVRAR